MICLDCDCGCKILPDNCLAGANDRIRAAKMYEKTSIASAVNSFLLIGENNDGILGQTCFDELCAAIKQAQTDADQYHIDNPTHAENDPLASFWAYLPAKWLKLLKSPHFVNMYAFYTIFYYYNLGYADAETTLDGDINHNRSGNINLNDGTKNVTLADATIRENKAKANAQKFYNIFVNVFWKANKNLYNCNTGNCDNSCENVVPTCTCNTGLCTMHNYRYERPRPTTL